MKKLQDNEANVKEKRNKCAVVAKIKKHTDKIYLVPPLSSNFSAIFFLIFPQTTCSLVIYY